MNPRMTDMRLLDHKDYSYRSELPPDYFERDPFATRWFHFLLGMTVGAGFCAIIMFYVFASH